MEINERIQEFLEQSKIIMSEMKSHSERLKTQNEMFGIVEGIKYRIDQRVFVVKDHQYNKYHFTFNEPLNISSIAIFNEKEGTDNRDEITIDKILLIEELSVSAFAYGDLNSSYGKYPKSWWYRVGYGADFINERYIAGSKEELISRFSDEILNIKQSFFNKRWAHINAERIKKIEEAKKLLQESGVQ